MKFEKENLKVLPLATIGLAMGVYEVYVKPIFHDTAKDLGRVAANIQIFTKDESLHDK